MLRMNNWVGLCRSLALHDVRRACALTVTNWLQEPKKLEGMREAALAAATPAATQAIATDLLSLLDEGEKR